MAKAAEGKNKGDGVLEELDPTADALAKDLARANIPQDGPGAAVDFE